MEYLYEQDLNEFTDLQHIEWLAGHLDEFAYSEKGLEIRDKLSNAIRNKNTFYDVCESSYREFIDVFNNNPYDYQLGILGKTDIETDHPLNYFVPWDFEGITYMVPVGYLMEKTRDNDYRYARTIILEQWRDNRKECVGVINSVSAAREQGRAYAKRIQNIFGYPYEESERFRKYKNELWVDTIVCFALCLVYIYCLRENGVVDFIKLFFTGSAGKAITMINGNIGLIIKIIAMIYIGIITVIFSRKVFWKTFISKRLTQIYEYCNKTRAYDGIFKKIERILATEINEDAVMEKHCFDQDICGALQLSSKRFSSIFLKEIQIEQYLFMYRGVSKGMLWYIPACVLLSIFL